MTSWKESTGNEAHVSEQLLPKSQLGRVDVGQEAQPAKPRTGEQGLETILPTPNVSQSLAQVETPVDIDNTMFLESNTSMVPDLRDALRSACHISVEPAISQ